MGFGKEFNDKEAMNQIEGDKTTPSKKRKAPEELSTNPNTAKSRARNDRLAQDPITKQILASEKADQQAVTRAYAKLETNQEYQKASSEMKISMREQVRQAKLNERRMQGNHTDNLKEELGLNGKNAQFDDGNPAWVSETFAVDEDAYEENLTRIDDEYNCDHIDSQGQDIRELAGLDSEDRFQKANKAVKAKAHKAFTNDVYRRWRFEMLEDLKSLKRKLHFLEMHSFEMMIRELKVTWDPETYTLYPIPPPHLFFTDIEKALWRNIQMTMCTLSSTYTIDINAYVYIGKWHGKSLSGRPASLDDEVYTLPGPAEWWSMVPGYNEKKAGFYLPDGDTVDFARFMKFLIEYKSLPTDKLWDCIDPKDKELRLVLPAFFS